MLRTMILNAYRMLAKFTLPPFWFEDERGSPRSAWETGEPPIAVSYCQGEALAPGATLVEELAGSALNAWRRNEVFSRYTFQVRLNHAE